MIHITQRHILDVLSRSETGRYSDIKPQDVDGNVFGYHLKQLITAGQVDKNDDGTYSLTESGRNYIINRYEDPMSAAHSIFLLVIRRGDDYLVRERLVQPLLGFSGFIHGEPKLGEDVSLTAQKRLLDKTGLKAELQIAGSGLITIKKNDQLHSFSHAIILTGETSQLDIIEGDATGRNYWTNQANLDQADFIPSSKDILNLLGAKQAWFELSYDL